MFVNIKNNINKLFGSISWVFNRSRFFGINNSIFLNFKNQFQSHLEFSSNAIKLKNVCNKFMLVLACVCIGVSLGWNFLNSQPQPSEASYILNESFEYLHNTHNIRTISILQPDIIQQIIEGRGRARGRVLRIEYFPDGGAIHERIFWMENIHPLNPHRQTLWTSQKMVSWRAYTQSGLKQVEGRLPLYMIHDFIPKPYHLEAYPILWRERILDLGPDMDALD